MLIARVLGAEIVPRCSSTSRRTAGPILRISVIARCFDAPAPPSFSRPANAASSLAARSRPAALRTRSSARLQDGGRIASPRRRPPADRKAHRAQTLRQSRLRRRGFGETGGWLAVAVDLLAATGVPQRVIWNRLRHPHWRWRWARSVPSLTTDDGEIAASSNRQPDPGDGVADPPSA